MRLRHVLSAVFALSLGIAAHADTFSYTLNGGASGFSGTGTLTGTSVSNGVFLITGITGTNVTGLIGQGAFHGNDNLLFPGSNAQGGTVFDSLGLGFTDQNSTGVYKVDLYGSGGNYYAFVTDNTNFSSTVPVQFSVTPVAITPEPSTLALLGTGVLGVFGMARRRFASAR